MSVRPAVGGKGGGGGEKEGGREGGMDPEAVRCIPQVGFGGGGGRRRGREGGRGGRWRLPKDEAFSKAQNLI